MDRDGQLFAPTEEGLGFLAGDSWETIGIEQGLPVNPTCCVLQDREGSIWVGLSGAGVARWRGYGQWQSWTRSEGLAGSNAQAIYRDRSGTLWVGTENGLQRFGADGKFSRAWTEKDGLGGRKVRALTSSADGAIWVGSAPGGVSRLDPRSGRIRRFQLGDGQEEVLVAGFAMDGEGRLWVTTQGSLYRSTPLDDSPEFERQIPPLSSAAESFGQMLIDAKGRWWLGRVARSVAHGERTVDAFHVQGRHAERRRGQPGGNAGRRPLAVRIRIPPESRACHFEHGKPRFQHYSERNGLKSDEVAALGGGFARLALGHFE